MADQPKPKRQVAVAQLGIHTLKVNAVPDVISTLLGAECVASVHESTFLDGAYIVSVNPLFDTQDVVEWIESMG